MEYKVGGGCLRLIYGLISVIVKAPELVYFLRLGIVVPIFLGADLALHEWRHK
jgi:hypothetical protein